MIKKDSLKPCFTNQLRPKTYDLYRYPMRRFPTNIQNLLLIGLGFPVIGLNLWVLSQFFRYFEHLITILTIAALIGFLLNYPVKILERLHFRRIPAIIGVLLLR